ncbi:6-phosphogluconolactonase [Coniophora puteana RWD-64-598 SS2]|uniref:6-phosphogluconolactonase n=1 Tax=Coniophora puteana (strain RWD-64-598) TaxID=741705 RepID=A0A5M3N6L4_CONPW|nr:6-phosphogluconolactonase [Coniophora puteana RWD-64-598 SS2]EIW86501.1 6-phosphogluconolactonase [Coniophora puteana RWD-64-598 SS2]
MTSLHQPPAPAILNTFAEPAELEEALAQFVVRAQRDAIDKKGRFTLAISGGSLPKQLGRLVGNPNVKWDKWQVFYADERAVPLDHPDSNHRLCTDELWSKVPLPFSHIHAIDADLLPQLSTPDKSTDDALDELADAYESQLIAEFAQKDSARFPVFDLLLLGLGPDGHTCSLFPGHALLAEEDRWVAWIKDSPKPPAARITFTFPVINHAARVAFVAAGASKADTLAAVLDHPEDGLPASRVRPAHPGQVFWFVDEAAAQKVQYPRSEFKL